MKSFIHALTLAVITMSIPAIAEQCEVSKRIHEEFPASAISTLKINALAGYLEISATESGNISFSGRACSDEPEWLERMSLDIERDDDVLILTVMIPYDDQDFDARYAHMDIDITLPADLVIEVKDSSGDIFISNVSASRIDDSSGNIRVSQNLVPINIRDSSGKIDVRDLRGDLEISDSSGDIEIREVYGSVRIPRDSSGDIDIETVTGIVDIERDGSGDIDISDISADVSIGSDGSGSIKINSVQGGVFIGSDGSGMINITNISGNLLVQAKGSGDVRTRGIEGEISLPR